MEMWRIINGFFFLCHPAATKSKEQSFLGQWELMYADLALTDDDMKWLMCSSAVMCRLAQSPFLCLWGRRVLPSLIPRCAEHKCCAFKGLNIQMPLQFLPPCSSSPAVFNAFFFCFYPPMKVPNHMQGKGTSKRKEPALLELSSRDCWCIGRKYPFIYQNMAVLPPVYKFNSASKLGLITTASGHNQRPWSNQEPALDRKGYFHK